MTLSTIAGPGNEGFCLETSDARMISTGACAKGDVVAVTEETVDSSGTKWTTVLRPVTADIETGIFAIAMEDVAATKTGWFRFRGTCEILLGATLEVGAELSVQSDAYKLYASTQDDKVVAKLLVAGDEDDLCMAVFDGINGLAHKSSS